MVRKGVHSEEPPLTLLDSLLPNLKREEGWAPQVYIDTKGFLTIGYGFNLGKLVVPPGVRVQILPVNSLPMIVGETLLLGKVMDTLGRMKDVFPAFDHLDPVRKEVLADMAYNMGPEFVTPGHEKSWPHFMEQVERGDFEAAAANMEATLWYHQVGNRSHRLTEMMRTGIDPGISGPRVLQRRTYFTRS